MSLTEDRHDRVMRAQSSAGMTRGWRHRMQDDPRVSHSGARWHTAALLFVVALAVGYWLWFGTTQRSIIGDEGICRVRPSEAKGRVW